MQPMATFPPACLLCSPVYNTGYRRIGRYSDFAKTDWMEKRSERPGFACRSARDRPPQSVDLLCQELVSGSRISFRSVSISLRISIRRFPWGFQFFYRCGTAPASDRCPKVHFASLRDSALNTTSKPRLTENSDQENDMGATQRRQSARSQWLAA